MDINDLFDGIMKSINEFGRQVQETGRGPENGGKHAENFEAEEKAAV